MKFGAAIVFLASLASSATAFAPSKASLRSTSALNIVAGDTAEEFAARVDAAFEAATPIDPEFEALVQDRFPGAIANQNFVTRSVNALQTKGYNGENTLLATSLCCDELARQLEDDYNKVFGNNFNLGGLAGFPFAGTTGFGAMAAHIPDDGYCLIVYGPHVGITAAGQVGKVERSGIKLVDTCCGSAVAAKGYVMDILNGEKAIDVGIQGFINFQQQGVQELILPHGKRLADAENDQIELPYALYDSQKVLIEEIISKGSTGIKRGLALLGGIQINTGPDTPDYFVPLQFDYMNYRGEVVADMLDSITE